MADQFRKRKVAKKYTALTWGRWDISNGEINNSISRDRKVPTKYTVSKKGKRSVTYYKVEREFRHCSLVSFTPKTGRTHQLRVHASHNDHPIFGDEKYGGGLLRLRVFCLNSHSFIKEK